MTGSAEVFNTPVAPVLPSDVRNVQQPAKSSHFRLPFVIPPNYRTPSFAPDVDRLLAAIDRLSCCPECARRWVDWVVEGRYGQDAPAALAAIVLAMATQHGETTISQQDQVSWMQKTTSPPC